MEMLTNCLEMLLICPFPLGPRAVVIYLMLEFGWWLVTQMTQIWMWITRAAELQSTVRSLEASLQESAELQSTVRSLEASLQELISLLDNQIREKLEALECPVCLCPASAPIYACPESHIICSNCLPRLAQCGVCRVDLRSIQAGQSLVKRHRYAEKMEEEVERLKVKRRGLGI